MSTIPPLETLTGARFGAFDHLRGTDALTAACDVRLHGSLQGFFTYASGNLSSVCHYHSGSAALLLRRLAFHAVEEKRATSLGEVMNGNADSISRTVGAAKPAVFVRSVLLAHHDWDLACCRALGFVQSEVDLHASALDQLIEDHRLKDGCPFFDDGVNGSAGAGGIPPAPDDHSNDSQVASIAAIATAKLRDATSRSPGAAAALTLLSCLHPAAGSHAPVRRAAQGLHLSKGSACGSSSSSSSFSLASATPAKLKPSAAPAPEPTAVMPTPQAKNAAPPPKKPNKPAAASLLNSGAAVGSSPAAAVGSKRKAAVAGLSGAASAAAVASASASSMGAAVRSVGTPLVAKRQCMHEPGTVTIELESSSDEESEIEVLSGVPASAAAARGAAASGSSPPSEKGGKPGLRPLMAAMVKPRGTATVFLDGAGNIAKVV